MIKRPLTYAKAQLEGNTFEDEGSRFCTCKKCNGDFYIDSEREPCAFCDGCKDVILDMFAKTIVNRAARTPRRR